MSPRYWRSLDEKAAGGAAAEPEFPGLGAESGPFAVPMSRRRFLEAAGFSLGAAVLAGCARGPANKVLSALSEPEDILPGRASWYASACRACPAGCGALVKVLDGRPLKLEGIEGHPVSRGGLCAVGQASVLELYDDLRLKGPMLGGTPVDWAALDREVTATLAKESRGRSVRVLSHTLTSPSLRAAVQRFLHAFPDGRHVVYDPLSASALLDAHELAFGARVAPRLRFELARCVAAFDADFLGTWVSPVEYAAGYRAARSLAAGQPFARHIQVESRLSLTGANADRRVLLAPRDVSALLASLADELARRAGMAVSGLPGAPCPVDGRTFAGLADPLWAARGRSLVLCGTNDAVAQRNAVLCNAALGNYGRTLDLERPSWQRQGDDRAAQGLLEELTAGRVGALFVLGANPVVELPEPEAWRKALASAGLVVSLANHRDETADLARAVAPEGHPFEGWSDAEAVAGVVSIAQPTIRPMFDTRGALASLAAWSDAPRSDRELVREHWRRSVFPRAGSAASFDAFWDAAVERGFAEVAPDGPRHGPLRAEALRAPVPARADSGAALTLTLHPTVALLGGEHSGNPWLQELPDPVTKVAWDNYASLSVETARRLGVAEGDVVRLAAAGRSVELPAHIQPGQHDGVIAAALGYGRRASARFADVGPRWLEAKPTVLPGGAVGSNLAPLLVYSGGTLQADVAVTVERTGESRPLACTQAYHTLAIPPALASRPGEKRDMVRETTLAEHRRDPAAGNPGDPPFESLWPRHAYPGHRWAMAVDLSACTGCSACMVACQAENNVPVVGKDEVARRRDMAWLRVDRYYAGEGPGVSVVFQPMMCQQCENAPCETVCPVLATMHSSEGLNQQIYNRCVGTRYCENNCPYKTRRFNWFQYQEPGRLSNLALNPDVTVRVRGVMEKCTFCVQRIQEAKGQAKSEARALADGDVRPACAQSCPARAIVFGDVNDPASRVSAALKDPRGYHVLAELNVLPSVGYLLKVRDREPGEGSDPHV